MSVSDFILRPIGFPLAVSLHMRLNIPYYFIIILYFAFTDVLNDFEYLKNVMSAYASLFLKNAGSPI